MKVLIAEDDVTSRTMLKAILTKWGYEVVAAVDGEEAWEVMKREDAPKLAVLDWEMPGLDGTELCRKVRGLKTDTPPYLILLTMRGEKGDIVEGLSAGANDYISKPYDAGELEARIRVGSRVIELQDRLYGALMELSRQAMTDPLTSAPNRRAILEKLKAEMARSGRENTRLWISILDIDHFKEANDRCGHLAGDGVLMECIRRIQGVLRPYDLVGRWGGDEFLVIVPTTSAETPPSAFERIQAAITESEFQADGTFMRITVSQGVAVFEPGDTMDDFIRKADEAMYRVKEGGRNGTACTLPPGVTA
jgi:two-component system, cell cycle response regulator